MKSIANESTVVHWFLRIRFKGPKGGWQKGSGCKRVELYHHVEIWLKKVVHLIVQAWRGRGRRKGVLVLWEVVVVVVVFRAGTLLPSPCLTAYCIPCPHQPFYPLPQLLLVPVLRFSFSRDVAPAGLCRSRSCRRPHAVVRRLCVGRSTRRRFSVKGRLRKEHGRSRSAASTTNPQCHMLDHDEFEQDGGKTFC